MSRFRSRTLFLLPFGVVPTVSACPPSDQPTVSAAQVYMETQDMITSVHSETAYLQDQIDSLRREVERQDSLIRVMFNLQGNPLPPRPVAFPPE